MSELVRLNVGETPFTSTRTTLCARGGTLPAMFGGDEAHTPLCDSEGRFFIDRDGTHFSLVLNYLRDGGVPLPTCTYSLEQLRAEAKFYDLPGLSADIDAALTLQQKQALEASAQRDALAQAAKQAVDAVVQAVENAAFTVQHEIFMTAFLRSRSRAKMIFIDNRDQAMTSM